MIKFDFRAEPTAGVWSVHAKILHAPLRSLNLKSQDTHV